ncbi:translation initiation factor eIF-2B subunit beta [Cucurbitaria berberidis CBS 394.84]|uniref:Translation initiation factor eIF2B subunit beta n=1 Tax=Cucurbitaria berberidis CBS 394.84 TaxID=1168544 RepID=A0A9P4GNT3_9PLEO|nr:translation initiation factor eIF-2B subunit beta [Cucurbitaria berberidis CBS 394.84]KAF1849898.1 translation initiation factor eIF-2B subunit beta [Cucurbitaria berberidis CBS 394.84]
MAQGATVQAPGLSTFLKSLKTTPVDPSVEHLISLLKRRQIRNSRPCALATTALLLRVVGEFKGRDAAKLVERIRQVGRRLTSAQPREVVVGNIVRRVLGLVREVVDENADGQTPTGSEPGHATPHAHHDSLHRPSLNSSISTFSPLKHAVAEPMHTSIYADNMSDSSELSRRPPLLTSHTSYAPTSTAPLVNSLFGLFSQPAETPSNTSTPTGQTSPNGKSTLTALNLERLADLSRGQPTLDLKGEVMEGIRELQDELETSDKQIAEVALEHIHANEIILTHTASTTVQKFLLFAARKRKFTVVHAETYPHDHTATHGILLTGKKRESNPDDDEDSDRWKPLTEAGIQVYVIPDSHIFAIMSRVNKVILATHTVLANGSLVAAAGAHMIAKAAKEHKTPVVVLSGVYKLSPVYPFDIDELIEHGDAGSVVPYEDGEFVDKVDVENPLYDYVPADLVDLYITNLGGHAPSYLYRIVADHYRSEDITL